MLDEKQKQEIIGKLNQRFTRNGNPLKCPMCGDHQFTLTDAYLNHTLQNDLTSFSLGGQSIPTIGIVCTNCGFLSQHVLGIIGSLPNQGGGNE